ncbi:MAG: acetyl-CoA C-acyltransferase [Cyanobacteria bacterium DS2.008]|jgi:acetyl-CoA C-acetyltransferase|nr:acetyl-CoA C-acyltransferase [Cyanobacteria bacterium DS2.008]
MKSGSKVYLLSGSRTPIGSFGRSLKSVTVDKLAGHAMVNAIRRANIVADAIDQIILGHGYQSSYTPNTARFAQLESGLPPSIPAYTVQRQCGSGMQAVNDGMRLIALGDADLVLAGGAESMSTIPYLLPGSLRWTGLIAKYVKFAKMGPRPTPFALADNGLAPTKLLKDMKTVYMAGTAQRLADAYNVTREEADEYALRSQTLANEAIKSGRFDIEIDPIEVPGRGFFTRDEHARKTSKEALAGLKPVLGTKVITAGNASGINDGACALVIASEAKTKELGATPLAELVDSCTAGVDPEQMGIGPVAAIQKLLERNGLTLADIDLIELNEAFATQYLACEKLLGLDRSKVNVNGGAIALGHPIGVSGARLILTMAHELKLRKKKLGIAALCIGGGMGIATLIRNPEFEGK